MQSLRVREVGEREFLLRGALRRDEVAVLHGHEPHPLHQVPVQGGTRPGGDRDQERGWRGRPPPRVPAGRHFQRGA